TTQRAASVLFDRASTPRAVRFLVSPRATQRGASVLFDRGARPALCAASHGGGEAGNSRCTPLELLNIGGTRRLEF
ncbi:MAG: hypothetical protein ACRD9L_14065, partial [Bryobacteraceae bacterium]